MIGKINYFGDNLIAAISSRSDGSMRLHGIPLIDEVAQANRLAYLSSLKVDPKNFVSCSLIHGANVEIVSNPKRKNTILEKTDSLITGEKNVFLSIMNADCFSLYLHDPAREVIALAHCGWKGILTGVIENTIDKMQSGFESEPANIQAYIGPGIRECHFEVGAEVAARFTGFVNEYSIQTPIPGSSPDGKYTHETKKVLRVDLEGAIEERLVQAGLKRSNIAHSNQCTYCYKAITELKKLPEKSIFEYQYFSFRRDKSDPLATQMAVFGMKKEGEFVREAIMKQIRTKGEIKK